MLNIENIGSIVGMFTNGRQIIEAGEWKHEKFDKQIYYVFKIAAEGNGVDYNRAHDIVLARKKGANGSYQMFNMGLEAKTTVDVYFESIKKMTDLNFFIGQCLHKTQTWYTN